ncbi:hypothetical protein FRB99_004299 [Tulasnella sp. 403]|nr:hypothetical protein FRB99_004299 [Tulasnella sp. 403]
MSATATAIQQSTTSNAPSTIKMNSSFYQTPTPGQQQGHPPQPAQQQFPAGIPAAPYPGVGFPQQPFNPQQQQFAQWAYQQMMFQQQQLAFQPHGPMAQPPFGPSPQQALQLQLLQQQQQQQFLMQQQAAAAAAQQGQLLPQPPQPPYARENNGSRSSLHSSNGSFRSTSNDPGTRRRTTSNKSTPSVAHSSGNARTRTNSNSASGHGHSTTSGRSSPATPLQPPTHRHRVSSTGSQSSAAPASATLTNVSTRSHSGHSTSHSISSSKSSATTSPSTPNNTTNASSVSPSGSKVTRLPNKPSPLSQGSSSLPSSKSVPKDPSPAPKSAMPDQVPTAAMLKSGGLKGRLRRALSFSALDEASHDDSKVGSRRKAVNAKLVSEGQVPARPSMESAITLRQSPESVTSPSASTVAHTPTEGSIRSIGTSQAPKKSRSLFNAKFNRSTDNMSLSSTVSSASVMIRKLGSVGKLVRRNSLMGISNMFRDKKKDKADSDGEAAEAEKKKGKLKKGASSKGGKAEASVSHATVELEPGSNSNGDGNPGDDLTGLSPAAKLARQHTLRSRAADAARAKAENERNQRDEAGADGPTPVTWEKSTTTTRAINPRKTVSELGQAGWANSDEEASDEEGTYEAHGQRPPQTTDWREHAEQDSEEEEDDEYGYPAEDEDDTVRLDNGEMVDEPWAVGVRRSVERQRVPAKGILKNGQAYDQQSFLDGPPVAPFARIRSNSNDSAPPMGAEPGPLARIPSPDPDHIDGLHRSNSGSDRHSHHSRKLSTSSNSSGAGISGLLPALSFEEADSSSLTASLSAFAAGGGKERPLSGHSSFSYSNPDFNASAPALAQVNTTASQPAPPNMAIRSATVPLTRNKKLTFAANLSVYHTFSPMVYDRRSEPATCNRLTPALAQRIKEELNSYKMEEMEVHQASRMHTHFFV